MADPADGRQRIPALSPFEEQAKFTRAIRVGDRIIVSGNVGGEADGSFSPDAGRQAERCFEQILDYIGQLGGHSGDVVRVRMFVTDISRWQEYSRAHGEFFADIRPVSTMVEVSRLIDPEHLIEIEVDAIIGNAP